MLWRYLLLSGAKSSPREKDDMQFNAADQAWDIALQLAALRHARGLTQSKMGWCCA